MCKYQIATTPSYEKELKKLSRFQLAIDRVVHRLANDESLEDIGIDCELNGKWAGFRACYIRADLPLIYKKEGNVMLLVYTKLLDHSDPLRLSFSTAR